jgi:hypothetical protein
MSFHNESRAEFTPGTPEHQERYPDSRQPGQPARAPWYHSTGELADFCRWLCDTGRIPNDPFEVVEKPWKWEAERQEWLRTEEQDALADQWADDDRWAA